MDELAAKLRARGIDAHSYGHAIWQKVAAEARQRYAETRTPIVLVGHSWGAIAEVLIAAELAKTGTPVARMIIYDTTDSLKIPLNVRHVINFNSFTAGRLGLTATGEPGFSGAIDMVNESQFGHLNIDNAAVLHELSIAAIMKVIHPPVRAARK